MNEYALEMHEVAKVFGNKPVLNGVDLRVAHGRTFAFLGRNGAGKTTAIRMALGLVPRTEGEIRVLGFDPERDPLQLRANVGYLAEDQTMYPWMRVDELLAFVAPFYPTWDQDLALRYVLDFDVPTKAKVGHLSKGQTVRLGLVLALAHRPRMVILDDPALGLDPVMRKQFNRDLITHLQAEGRTVFYSSHLLYEVEPIADEVAILHGGRIVRQTATESLRSDIKQLVMSRAAYAAIGSRLKILDERASGDDVAVIVEQATAASLLMSHEGVEHRTVDLNLDEIFEAYVAGHRLPSEGPLAPELLPDQIAAS